MSSRTRDRGQDAADVDIEKREDAATTAEAGTAVVDRPRESRDDGLAIEPAEWSDMPRVVEIIRSSADWYEIGRAHV